MTNLFGYKIVTSPIMVDRFQFRFPRSKKRRIRKKWSKRYENYKTAPKEEVFIIGDSIICHPSMAVKIEDEMKRQNEIVERKRSGLWAR